MTNVKTRFGMIAAGFAAALLAVVLSTRAISAWMPPAVSGIVAGPTGSLPVANGAYAMLFNLDGSIKGVSTVVSATGVYSFPAVEPGIYLARGEPPIGTLLLTPSDLQAVTVLTQPVTVPTLTLSLPSITGTVYAPNGVTYARATIEVYSSPHNIPILVETRDTNLLGAFALGGLPAGTYKIVAKPWPNLPDWKSQPMNVNLNPGTPQYMTMTLQPAVIGGLVKDTLNLPIEGAVVHAVSNSGRQRNDVSGSTGLYAIGDFNNGEVVTLTVDAPPDRGALIPPLPVAVTVSVAPTIVPLTFTYSTKEVQGWVHTNTNISVTKALIEAQRIDRLGHESTTTDSSGNYTLKLAPGYWSVSVHVISTTAPANWLYPSAVRVVQFDPTTVPEVKRLNFNVLTADATVMGAIVLPDGVTAPPFTVTVALHNDEGIGASQDATNGQFTLQVPHGNYNFDLKVHSLLFAAPSVTAIYADALAPTIIPTITLLARDAYLTGLLVDGNSQPAADMPLIAWSADTHATFGTRSGPNGTFVLGVYSGTWLLRPAPTPDQAYVFTGDASSWTAQAGLVTSAGTFTLTNANATLQGVLLDANRQPVANATGWAAAVSSDQSVKTGAAISDGMFDLHVPAGAYTVTARLPGGQPYMSDGQPQLVTAIDDQTTNVTFTLILKDAKFRGVTLNRDDKSPINNVDGHVWAKSGDLWTGTDLKASGFFTLPVPAGVWQLNYNIDPESPFLKTGGPRTYALQAGQRQDVVLPIAKINATLTGTVVLTDGVTPAVGAVVVARAVSAELNDVTIQAQVDDSGRFTMTLPWGLYNVRSTQQYKGLINPREVGVFIPRNGSAHVALQYRSPDSEIRGVVGLFSFGQTSGRVHIYGWTADDGYSEAASKLISGTGVLTATYRLPALSGEAWKLVAVYETVNREWMTRTLVNVPVATPVVFQNLDLGTSDLKPGPVTVLFDPTQNRSIELADGTRIFIPAGSMPATGNVILHITPIANAQHELHGDPIGLSYVFEAYTEDGQLITQNFNQDVLITFKYKLDELAELHLDPDHLRVAYFSTTTNSWTKPDSFLIDKDQHEITLQIDHFTRFAMVRPDSGSALYLPLVLK